MVFVQAFAGRSYILYWSLLAAWQNLRRLLAALLSLNLNALLLDTVAGPSHAQRSGVQWCSGASVSCVLWTTKRWVSWKTCSKPMSSWLLNYAELWFWSYFDLCCVSSKCLVTNEQTNIPTMLMSWYVFPKTKLSICRTWDGVHRKAPTGSPGGANEFGDTQIPKMLGNITIIIPK